MDKILRTDSAYQAIDKINANFALASTSGNKEIDDYITGAGGEIVRYYFDAKPGDYIHVSFPDGNWSGGSTGTYKFQFGYTIQDDSRVLIDNICQLSWVVPTYGYDLYFPDDAVDMKQGWFGFRAPSGTRVPFSIEWLSKEEMKPIYSNEMIDTVEKVRARQGDGTVTLAVCTDLHYRCVTEGYRPFAPFNAIGMGLAMKELGKRVRLDNIVCMGDIIQGEQTAAIAKRDADDMQRSFARAGVPIIVSIGNHDDNQYYARDDGDRKLTKAEIHAYFIEYNDERTSVGGAEQECNTYRDIDRHKLRLISLLATDLNGSYNFTAATRIWLTNTFASMPTGYKAVIFTHTPLQSDHSYGGSFPGGSTVASIIEANADKFIAIFYGHTHFDNVWMSPLVEINVASEKCYNLEGAMPAGAPEGAFHPDRAAGDATEQLFDAVVLNQTQELLSCIRFGAGYDRHIHYTLIELAAGGTTTLTPAVLTATGWSVRTADAASISVAGGVVSIDAGATSGSRLMVWATDADGNMEVWAIKVS